ncbi:cell division protein FtsQ/DivIB [Guyparkeria sp.]|uniref:cell division protein FtsQ/DivIB n=1 Tax=Guyparkeria sp. TaxID=2035736 RepID=UPI00356A1CC3
MTTRRRTQARPKGPTWRERCAAFAGVVGRALRIGMTVALWVGFVGALVLVAQRVWVKLDVPIQEIVVEGNNRFVSAEQVEQTLDPWLGRSIWEVELEAMRARLLEDRWLTEVTITRQWPARLRVELATHRPIAYWGEGALMSSAGEVFRPKDRPEALRLPRLAGPRNSQWAVWERYSSLRPVLEQVGLTLVGVELSPRGALDLTLDSGAVIRAGRQSLEVRLQRLLDVYPDTLEGRIHLVRSIDLRYSNGFAVAWRDDGTEQAEK